MTIHTYIMSKRHYFFIAIFIIFFILPGSVLLLTDWFWFQQTGFENVFTTILSAKLLIGFGVGILVFLLIYLNLRIASRLTRGKPVLINLEPGRQPIELGKHVNKIALGFAIFIGFTTGAAEAGNWDVILKFLNSTPFNTQDPIFGRDISFYFFTLPFLKMVLGILFWITLISLAGSFLIYFSRGALASLLSKLQATRHLGRDVMIGKHIEKRTKVHLLLMLFFLFLILAARTYFIRIPELLYSNTGPFTGASFSDIHASLPILKLSSIALLFLAIAFLVNIFRESKRLLFTVFGVYIAIAIIASWAYPSFLQSFVVEPNELVKETPYIKHNIAATQQAYKLDKISEFNLEGQTSLTMSDIENNETTIKNIRLWDREPLLDTFGQLQEIRTYYDFVSIDNDRYMIDGEYRQTLLSARELNSRSLPQKNFINERLTFTHGYGVTVTPVNEVTNEGLPVLFVKDLPPVSEKEALNVKRPEIFYGELTSNYVIANTKAKEFDYPSGEENVYKNYDGNGGVKIDSFVKKVLMAFRFREAKLVLSDDITSESRIMFYRNVQDRIRKVFPFLELDDDPYLVIAKDGSLQWIQDAYTVSDRYPYAERIRQRKQINYIRNSVKIVVSAFDGSMKFYVSDPSDPVINTYEKIFSGSFNPISEMPDDLKSHVRYPEDIFIYQTALYTIYHMEEPQIFYNKEDMWQIPVISEGSRDPMIRHIIMKLPSEENEEYILMIPFTPQGKDNMAAWMVARSDGDNYGKMAVYRFPKQTLVYGPQQIINRINQDPEISRQISLWDQRGSEVNQGSLLVIPIEESLLYVRPLYLRSEGGKIPELRRVIVAYENTIVMEETLDEAIRAIFGKRQGKSTKAKVTPESPEKDILAPQAAPSNNTISQARRHYDAAIRAQREGDWASYGEEIKKLGKILENMSRK